MGVRRFPRFRTGRFIDDGLDCLEHCELCDCELGDCVLCDCVGACVCACVGACVGEQIICDDGDMFASGECDV